MAVELTGGSGTAVTRLQADPPQLITRRGRLVREDLEPVQGPHRVAASQFFRSHELPPPQQVRPISPPLDYSTPASAAHGEAGRSHRLFCLRGIGPPAHLGCTKPARRCEMICRASSTSSRTISPAGLIWPTRPTPWPANKSIDSISPLASQFGGSPMNRSTGVGCPPTTVRPTAGSSGGDSWPRASWPIHCSTKAVRSVRCGALGQPWPNRVVRIVSPSPAPSTFCL